jgi:hypothetical protein
LVRVERDTVWVGVGFMISCRFARFVGVVVVYHGFGPWYDHFRTAYLRRAKVDGREMRCNIEGRVGVALGEVACDFMCPILALS